MRMYFRKHMTDVVRAFGYQELSREEACRRIEPLIATYGKPDIEAACTEIVEATPDGLWRLTADARRLAVGILGRPKPITAEPQPAEQPVEVAPTFVVTEPASPTKTKAPKRASRKSAKRDS